MALAPPAYKSEEKSRAVFHESWSTHMSLAVKPCAIENGKVMHYQWYGTYRVFYITLQLVTTSMSSIIMAVLPVLICYNYTLPLCLPWIRWTSCIEHVNELIASCSAKLKPKYFIACPSSSSWCTCQCAQSTQIWKMVARHTWMRKRSINLILNGNKYKGHIQRSW